jgi:hypothetical protein
VMGIARKNRACQPCHGRIVSWSMPEVN